MERHSHHILIVDDDPIIRSYVSYCLRGEGFSCLEAHDGQDALDKLGAIKTADLPQVALVDVRMPVLDGIGFVREARSRGIMNRTRVVFVTGEGLAPQLTIENTDYEVLSKPHNMDHIIALVREHFNA